MVLNASSGTSNKPTEDHGLDDFDVEVENLGVSDMADKINTQNAALNPGHKAGVRGLFLSNRGWAALRLPGGRPGQRGEFWNSLASFIPFWSGTTIRDSPYKQMITAGMWQRYINNMDPLDDALEINAPYSPEEALTLRAFCEEWGNVDPGHVAFRQRLINHPSTNEADAILKGNMVYDICTRQIRLRTSPDDGRRGNNPIPIRLAHDILTSIPFREYNFYTLNSIHAEEGPSIYRDFLSRYIRLTATEVSMVEELENGIRAGGRGYANMSTSLTGDASEAYAIMQQTVEAMELGDTVTVRANLNALVAAPYNYQSAAMNINLSSPAGGNFVSPNQVVYVQFNEGKLGGKKKGTPETHLMYRQGRDTSGNAIQLLTKDNKIDPKTPEGFYMEIEDNGIGIKGTWEVFKIGDNTNIRRANQDDQALALSRLIGGFNAFDAAARDFRAGDEDPRFPRDADGNFPAGRPRRSAGRDRRPRNRGPMSNPRSNVPFDSAARLEEIREAALQRFASDYIDERLENAMMGTTGVFPDDDYLTFSFIYWWSSEPSIRLDLFEDYKKLEERFGGKASVENRLGQIYNGKFDIAFKDREYLRFAFTPNSEVRSNRFGGQGTMGRGSFIQVQLLPKTQVEFTGKHKGKKNATQFWEQGGTKVSDSTGLAGVFSGGPSNDGYFIKTAIHKRTGKPVPWLIALPRKSFEAFTDSKGRRTVRPKHRKAEANPAWEKFTSLYGVPTYSGGKGTKNLFKIKKADRGTFYNKLRATPTKK